MNTQDNFQQPTTGTIWRDRLLTAGAAVVIGMTLSATAPADETSRENKRAAEQRYDQSVRQAKADYKAARVKCANLSGNDRDVCVKEAKAAKTTSMSHAKAAKKNASTNAEAHADARGAQFEAAKQKCESMSGASKDACKKEAEARYRQ